LTPVWDRNLAALEARPEEVFRALARRIGSLGPALPPLRSRAGELLPVIQTAPGSWRSLESTFDAVSEAHRWVVGLPSEGTLVVFGGAPPALYEALVTKKPRRVVVVEPRAEVWQSLFTVRDFAFTVSQPWWFPEIDRDGDWLGRLGRAYHPLWDGPLTAKDWRSATDGAGEYWDAQRSALRETMDRWTGDFSTQARFGARWYRNTLENLRHGQPSHHGLSGLFNPSGVVVTGAGPGLEEALENPANRALLEGRATSGWRLFTTDTALPALTSRGIRPDAVLLLDGQLPSAQHFHPPLPADVPVIADLGSQPLFHRLGLPWSPFVSANPLHRIVERVYTGLPRLDGSSGNVSGLALRFAEAVGAAQVRLWGADLSYPDGKGYARGTYVYPNRHRRSGRLQPAESTLSAPCYGSQTLEWAPGHPRRYTTGLLRGYRQTMATLAGNYRPALEVGFPRVEPPWRIAGPGMTPLERPASTGDWPTFRSLWRRRLDALPFPDQSARFSEFVLTLKPEVAEDWLALWPLALALFRESDSRTVNLERLVAEALTPLQD